MHGAFFIHKSPLARRKNKGGRHTGNWPGKKESGGKESDMKLQWLKDILGDAYTEELDAKVCAALGERFVSRQDFNDKNTKLKEAEAQVTQLTESVKTRDRKSVV